LLNYDVFFSYARSDDVEKKITIIRDDLLVAYKRVTGSDLHVFWDQEEIRAADDWQDRIAAGMRGSTLLLAFVSPSYARSHYCRLEWKHFQERSSSVVPILLLPTDHIRDFNHEEQQVVTRAAKLQCVVIQEISKTPESYTSGLERLARDLYTRLLELRPQAASRDNVHVISERADTALEQGLRAEVQNTLAGTTRAFPNTLPLCVIYTGGSVGMVRSDPEDKRSPLKTAGIDEVIQNLPGLRNFQFDIDFYAYKIPLDSSNITGKHWSQMAELIQALYDHYQGFVILHGTDTMAYTASALSFMLGNLDKPVILTGAEKPMAEPGSDAPLNVTRAIWIAAPRVTQGPGHVPEVCVLFGKKLLRGNRTKKLVALDFEGFDSPNCPPLGLVEDIVDLDQREIRRSRSRSGRQQLAVKSKLTENDVIFFEIYPDMDPGLFAPVVDAPSVKAIILKTYGTGNAPTLPTEFLKMVARAIDAGKVLVNLTQCPKGKVEVRLFETNAHLFDLGVVNGGDMTTEAAYCKLKWLLKEHEQASGRINIEAVKNRDADRYQRRTPLQRLLPHIQRWHGESGLPRQAGLAGRVQCR
jgi:L-asparaginase